MRLCGGLGAAALVALLLVAMGLSPALARAQAPGLEITGSQASYAFPESLDFEVRVSGGSGLREVILFFGRVESPLVRRVYPAYSPSDELIVRYTEELEPGQYAPGTEFRFWWEFTLADGSTQATREQTFEYTDPRFRWEVAAGERVDLYHYGDARLADRLLAAAEEAIARLEDDTGMPVERRVRVYSYASARDMSLVLASRSTAYDDRVLTLGVAVDDHTLILLGAHRDAEMIVAHELSHIVVGIATANPFAGLPRWLDEGLAMYAEGHDLPDANRRALEAAIRRDALLSLRSMTSYSGQASQVDLYYGQAHSIVRYMLDEHGRDKMRELLSVFAEGSRQDDALLRVYGWDLAGLEDRWRESLGLEPRPRGVPTAAPQGLGVA
ncbi:MAG: hypothetical protein GX649_03765 [Chloroflexi bacterium]|nr:hypothetical protein [Chloroflexota bacterium]